MAKLLLLLAFALSSFVSPQALAAQQPGPAPLANTIHTSAEGTFEAAPDTAVIQFHISSQEAAPKLAYERAQRQAQTLRDIMKANGIDPASAELGFFSIQPVYDWKQPKRKIVGYQVSTNVSLKVKDFTKIGPLVQQLGEQEFAETVNLSYMLDDMEAAKLKAVEKAFQRARSEAAAVAKIGGKSLGDLVHASVDASTPGPIVPMMMKTMQARAEAADMAPPVAEFSPSNITVHARVSTLFSMK
ncbi:MAG: SIMPL domain-containing protein [Thermomicrobiales bacterium]